MRFRSEKAFNKFYELYTIIYNKKIAKFNRTNRKTITDSLDQKTRDYYEAYNQTHIDMLGKIAWEEAGSLYGTTKGKRLLLQKKVYIRFKKFIQYMKKHLK